MKRLGKKTLRVLMTADTVGGVWTYTVALCKALQTQGVEVFLATKGSFLSKNQIIDINQLPNVRVFESQYKLEWMDDPWEDVDRAGEWLLDLEKQIAPDVIHLNDYAHGILPWMAPVAMVGHSCVCSWWEAVHGHKPPSEWNKYFHAVQSGLACADIVVAPTIAMMESLRNLYDCFSESIVIPNASYMRGQMSTAPKQNCILGAGRLWDEAKNIRLLQKAAESVSWPVWLAGQTSSTIEHQNNIKTFGHVSHSELMRKMKRASIFAHPAKYEPFGLAPLEAAHCGCALVLGDIPSLREIWGNAAVYVRTDSAEMLSQSLEELIADNILREKLAAAAWARAQKYDPSRMGLMYRAVYDRLILEKGTQRGVVMQTMEAT